MNPLTVRISMLLNFIILIIVLLPSRAEVQHVLAEVTEHMAQQHSAHKSLEKLRAENESLAIKEKERKVWLTSIHSDKCSYMLF